MKVETLIRILVSAHYSYQVVAPAGFKNVRGGIMLVAPPGTLKTSILKMALESHSGALVLSDINVQALGRLRHTIASGKLQTLVFYEFAKIYKRSADVSSNVEGTLAALVDESYHKLAFDVLEAHSLPCSALVVGAMVPQFYEQKMRYWEPDGFARRFIWSMYRLRNPCLVQEAIAKWQSVVFSPDFRFRVPLGEIPYSLTPEEAEWIQKLLANNHGIETPSILLQKIACVLRWENKILKRRDDTIEVLKDFGPSLSKKGTVLDI
jgi:hypothetical protein